MIFHSYKYIRINRNHFFSVAWLKLPFFFISNYYFKENTPIFRENSSTRSCEDSSSPSYDKSSYQLHKYHLNF